MNEKLFRLIQEYEPYDERERCDKQVMLGFIEQNEDVLTRENKIAHFTATGWIVNKDKTKVLMAFHNQYQSWSWIGGHADGDEDLFHVACKEIEEECGLSKITPIIDGIYGINVLTVEAHMKRGSFVNSHLHMDVEYLFEADEVDEVRIKEDENSGVRWIPIEEINDYVSEENMKPIYARLNERLAR